MSDCKDKGVQGASYPAIINDVDLRQNSCRINPKAFEGDPAQIDFYP
ncbi:MAG: hypothetical protein HY885_01375 [Deltaproteobacteria bacterium]|nr:hypothetical protein [Deltaproteobacteria bacterium]